MSKQHFINWIVFIVLVGLISWLVMVDMGRSGATHNFSIKSQPEGYIVPKTYNLQPTHNPQKSINGNQLYNLSNGVEMLPLEMLRSGQLSTPKQLINVCNNQSGYIVVSGCGYEVIQ